MFAKIVAINPSVNAIFGTYNHVFVHYTPLLHAVFYTRKVRPLVRPTVCPTHKNKNK